MGEYVFNINGKDYKVKVNSLEENVADIEINGKNYKVNFRQIGSVDQTAKKALPSQSPDKPILQSEKKSEGESVKKVLAPLPGVVLNVLVKEGDHVKEGQDLLIMEAMKMENAIHSPYSGKILKINVKKDDTISEGDILVEIGE
ncbi:MAG: biotin/lipoyl-containing protein [candidate division WOR-3 bacterium]